MQPHQMPFNAHFFKCLLRISISQRLLIVSETCTACKASFSNQKQVRHERHSHLIEGALMARENMSPNVSQGELIVVLAPSVDVRPQPNGVPMVSGTTDHPFAQL